MTLSADLLIIQHSEGCPPGHILSYAPNATTVRMWETPTALQAMAAGQAALPSAIVVLGGTENAYADSAWPWLADVRAVLRRCHEASVPTLAVCLGMQLAVVAGDGSVAVGAAEGPETGMTRILWEETADDPLVGVLAADEWVYADHSDAVSELPAGASVLARSDKYVHVMRWGSVVGVQYHPELTADILQTWLENNPPSNADQLLADYQDAADDLAQHCQRLCEAVLGAR